MKKKKLLVMFNILVGVNFLIVRILLRLPYLNFKNAININFKELSD